MPDILDCGYSVQFIKVPIEISRGNSYEFELKCDKIDTVGVVQNGKIMKTVDKNKYDKFEFDLDIDKCGYYSICIKEIIDETRTTMKFILKYNVE